MKNSSTIVFRENDRLSELSQIIIYLQQLAVSGINVAWNYNGVVYKSEELT
jgi:hypothetical protein